MSAIRIAVVGAGISGLAAAWRIRAGARAAGRPIELSVLEAEPRAGGHAWTTREEDVPVSFLLRDIPLK